jgi:hypothetical protein
MNPIEQAFSASLNDRGPNQGSASSKYQEDVARPIHEDETLCNYILSTTKAPTGALSIQQSTIPNSGSGLFTTRDLTEGELIFTSVPLVLCSEVGDNMEACDFCFRQRRRVFHPVEDRLIAPGEIMPILYKCKGCNLYQYCSQVSRSSHLMLFFPSLLHCLYSFFFLLFLCPNFIILINEESYSLAGSEPGTLVIYSNAACWQASQSNSRQECYTVSSFYYARKYCSRTRYEPSLGLQTKRPVIGCVCIQIGQRYRTWLARLSCRRKVSSKLPTF